VQEKEFGKCLSNLSRPSAKSQQSCYKRPVEEIIQADTSRKQRESHSIPGAQPFLHFGGGEIFMKFHSMTSSCLFNRGTTFSQTVTYNNNVFLPADTKYIVQRHTLYTTLDNKKHKTERLHLRWRLNHRRQEKFLTSRHMRMHRATFNISNTLRKLMIRA